MSRSCLRIFSPIHGFLREDIEAISIKSREDARKLGPFCNSEKSYFIGLIGEQELMAKRLGHTLEDTVKKIVRLYILKKSWMMNSQL